MSTILNSDAGDRVDDGGESIIIIKTDHTAADLRIETMLT